MVFGIFDFLKKTNENRSFSSKKRFSFVFLRKLKTPQSHFEINWPLAEVKKPQICSNSWTQLTNCFEDYRMLTFFLLPRVDKKYYVQKKYDIKQINSILLLILSRFAMKKVFPSCASSRPKAENLWPFRDTVP
jgi:hypothetical protein